MKNDSLMVDKRQVFLLFFSSILIMILVFGAGVFLGKKLSSIEVPKDRVESQKRVQEVEVQSSNLTIDAGFVDVQERLAKAENPPEEKKVSEVNIKGSESEKVAAKGNTENEEKDIKKKREEKREEKRVEDKKAQKVAQQTPEVKKQEITDAKFTLQVGAFPDRAQALKIAAELEKKGYESWIQRAKSKDKDIFRVRIGKFATKQEAEKFKQQFDKKERYNSFITPLE